MRTFIGSSGKYFGGGTALDLGILSRWSMEEKILIFSSLPIWKSPIWNRWSDFSDRFRSNHGRPYRRKSLCRQIPKAVEKKKNISIFTVKRKEDIPHIVLRIDYMNISVRLQGLNEDPRAGHKKQSQKILDCVPSNPVSYFNLFPAPGTAKIKWIPGDF